MNLLGPVEKDLTNGKANKFDTFWLILQILFWHNYNWYLYYKDLILIFPEYSNCLREKLKQTSTKPIIQKRKHWYLYVDSCWKISIMIVLQTRWKYLL